MFEIETAFVWIKFYDRITIIQLLQGYNKLLKKFRKSIASNKKEVNSVLNVWNRDSGLHVSNTLHWFFQVRNPWRITTLFWRYICSLKLNVHWSMAQTRSFAAVGSFNWNKLPHSLRDPFSILSHQFRKHLKNSLFISEDTDPGRECLLFQL